MLEARDRIGGRLHPVDLAGTPIDLGGSWIHHPIGNPLTDFCDEHGVGYDPGDPMPSLSGYDRAEARRLDHDEIDTYSKESDEFWDSIEAMAERLGPDANADNAIEVHIADRGLTGAAARRTRQELRAEIEADAPGKVSDQSLTWLAMDEEFQGSLFGNLPRGGYRSVVEALAGDTDIRLNVEAVAVAVEADGVLVTCGDGTVEAGSHVVVTVPLGVLKRGRPRFEPPLPVAVEHAIDKLAFGRYEKIALRFETPFWRDEGLSHLVVFPRDENEPSMWVFDLDAFGAGPVLCAHLFHTLTPYVLDQSSAAAVNWFKEVLAEIFGHPVPEPIATVVTGWANDPMAGGSYSHCPRGADPSMYDALAEQLHGRILLAGEHTQAARVGYADGAYVSGLRAARRLV